MAKGEQLTPLSICNGDSDIDEAITTYEATKSCCSIRKDKTIEKVMVTPNILEMCEERRKLNSGNGQEEAARKCREINNKV